MKYLVLGYNNHWYNTCDTLVRAQALVQQLLRQGEHGLYIWEATKIEEYN